MTTVTQQDIDEVASMVSTIETQAKSGPSGYAGTIASVFDLVLLLAGIYCVLKNIPQGEFLIGLAVPSARQGIRASS